jgi:HTH-type transcriptional regulator, quorum sensing regulator NprR
MSLGTIIKYHRIMNKWTQSELCNGICSVTHLSKIENNNKEANPNTISLLLARLGISYSDISQTKEMITNQLNQFFIHMVYYDKDLAREVYQSLKKLENQIILSENVNIYYLYVYRYYLLIGDLKKSLDKRDMLEKICPIFSQHENNLFQYCNAILFIQQGDYKKSLTILNTFEGTLPLPNALLGEFYYMLALSYSNVKNSSLCITYANKALREYSNRFNYYRTLHTQVLLAINYTELGLFHEANEQFTHLLRNVNIVNNTNLTATLHHNFAILCEKQLNFELAISHYVQAQEHALNPHQYYMSLCNLTLILINEGKKEDALKNIEIILKNTNLKVMKKYYLIFRYYEYLLIDKTIEAYTHLEQQVLPYLEKKNLVNEFNRYALLLADYYADINKDKAIYYYQKSKL